MRLRSAVSLAILSALPASAQTRAVDQGTFVITKGGTTVATESFKITRRDGGLITATGKRVSGSQQSTSALITDSLGTPVQYESHVTEGGQTVFDVKAEARSGRLASLSSTRAGDESMREYPMRAGRSVILDSDLVHQLYFASLIPRPAGFQAIAPRAARSTTVTMTARGMEPVDVGGTAVTGTHYSLSGGSVRYEFWVDSRNRLLRVEIPGAGLVAARDEAPK